MVLAPIYLLPLLLFPKSWHKHIIWFLHHVYTRIYFFLILIIIKVEGRKNLNPKQSYIIVSNHCTAIDFMANALAYPGVYKYLAKAELAKVPLFGMVVKRLCVLVDRASKKSKASSINNLKNTLEEGISVFIYPEGTRNRTERLLGAFHVGAFKIAIETQTPIAVQTIVRARSITKTGSSLDLLPGMIKIIWDQPIEVEGMEIADIPKLKEQVRQVMLKNLEGEH